ncbi:EamA/RhaT family transporter [Roseovarius sp. A46]|uniref:DMT family transporter n=1 Tax=Roseovarius sp. A46 TaxID=2109331 RepID=UPI0010135598|nr:DMT family transporter [Roseovarius sp. A46]RXV59299.1 EamA/RhaT family transporter [Roseovarius sp. A46]
MHTGSTGNDGEGRAILALGLATFFWSGNFIAGRAIGGAVPPLELNIIRWALCLLLLLPITLPALLRHRLEIIRAWRLILLLGLTGIAGFHTMVYKALTLTAAVNALLILSLAPVVTALGGALWNGYRPGVAQVGGLVLSACGGGIILLFGRGDGAGVGMIDQGALWMMGAIVVWAAYTLLLRHRPPSLPQDVTLTASVVVGVGAMALVLSFRGVQPVHLTGASIFAILYIAVFASLFGFLLWSWGLTRIGPERAGQFLHLMPVFGTLLAVLLLGERFLPAHGLGALLAIGGIALVNRTPRASGPRLRGPGGAPIKSPMTTNEK